MNRLVPAGIVTLLALLFSGAAAPATANTDATATGAEDDRVTWSVVPADEDGPDGRRVIDLELDPGGSATEHVAVTNYSTTPVTFALTANDGYLTERGSFDMLPSGTPPTDGGAWITLRDEVRVAPDETVVVPFDVEVPADATPGDHPAGVAASVSSSGSEVQVENRVGVRVNLRVTGEVVTALSTDVLSASYEPSLDPLAPGSVVVSYAVTNDGTVGLRASARVTATSRLGGGAASTTPEGREILPGGRHEATVTVPGVWPLGPTDVGVEVTGELPETSAAEAEPPETATAGSTVWAVPVVHLVLLLLLALCVLAVRDARRRRRSRLERLLEQARAQGRAEAAAGR